MNSIARQPQHELLPPPPRDVRRRRGLHPLLKAALFLLIPHVWIGIGMAAAVIGGIALGVAGQVHNARVVDRRVTQGKGTHYQIVYAYDESGVRYEDRATVFKEDYDRLAPGEALPVRSLHVGRFSTSRLADGRDRGQYVPWCIGPFAIVWNGVMFAVFYGLVLAPLRQAKLVRLGQAVTGRITSRKEQKGKNAKYTLNYAYATIDGHERTASMTVRKEDYDRHREGDEVIVLYWPDGRPGKSVIYDCAHYAATDPYGYPITV